MTRVLVVGYNAWDLIAPLAAVPPADSKHELPWIREGGGGPAATAAVALARLGCRVRLVTTLAGDAAGRAQRTELEAAGVDLSLALDAPDASTPRALILVDPADGGRRILWTRGGLPPLPPAAADPAWLDAADLLYLDSHEPAFSLLLARAARRRGMPVVLDAGTARPGTAELVPLCTDVVSSEIFAPALTGLDDPAAALRALAAMGPPRVGMTFGAAGCVGLDGGRFRHVPAFAVETRDTTGAGDAFHAGYAWALGRGRGFADCLRAGAAVAALKCRDYGGRAALPDAAEAEAMLRGGGARPELPPGWPFPSGTRAAPPSAPIG